MTRKAELVFGGSVSSLFWGWMARGVETLPFYTSLELFSPGSGTVEISLLSCGMGTVFLGHVAVEYSQTEAGVYSDPIPGSLFQFLISRSD